MKQTSYFSASFKNLYKSCESLIIFGYLKPNELRIETEKSDETNFLSIYHGIYGLTGKFREKFTVPSPFRWKFYLL